MVVMLLRFAAGEARIPGGCRARAATKIVINGRSVDAGATVECPCTVKPAGMVGAVLAECQWGGELILLCPGPPCIAAAFTRLTLRRLGAAPRCDFDYAYVVVGPGTVTVTPGGWYSVRSVSCTITPNALAADIDLACSSRRPAPYPVRLSVAPGCNLIVTGGGSSVAPVQVAAIPTLPPQPAAGTSMTTIIAPIAITIILLALALRR